MKILLAVLLVAVAPGAALAQREEVVRNTAWTIDPQFRFDTFKFVRLRPQFHQRWMVDHPDSDLNFPYRLNEITSLAVDPESITINITDPRIFRFPFTYIVEPGYMQLTEEEAEILRRYLLNGGSLMLDDFWGEAEWASVVENMRLIFPDREPVELPLEHPIFNTVFELKVKPQIPAMETAVANRDTGNFFEKGAADGARYYGIFDDNGRMMVIICRDTDLGDGWEREGDSEWFFREFSEKLAYPMGINIVTYLMTH